MSVRLDLEELPLSDSIEFLRDRMLSAPVPLALEPHPNADIIARTRVAELGGIHLLSTKSQGQMSSERGVSHETPRDPA